IRRLFKNVPLLLPKSISQSSPIFCRWISACRRDALGDSNTIVLAAARPNEQLPLIAWHVPSAASSQASSSGGMLMLKHIESNRRREATFGKGSFILDIAWQRVYERC